MAKQLNVNLAFNADTAKARQQIQELQKSLNDLVKHSVQNSATGDIPITKQLTEAQVAASKLQTILTQSVNMKTGNLDLTKFSQSLDQSGLKLTTLKNQLDLLGPSGQKAFVSLAQSIITADVPLARTSKLLNEMWTTMKNTVRWQLSSSILHGVMGAYQSAMGYAKDLDKSLNDIRIVTGQGVDEMARFAEQANRAAKALSTTTTEYTKASLIYYQQGLSDTEVAERTEVTVKMANAAGQSAQVVSDQLTAVWNNFYDGSKSLEYYADVMTALGAATASSTDEIAGGLNKFAAVGKTIGLSYEYAASALATITSNTRESEEVVGTALKTIFARIQGLNLGETLDDGTTLNKYSQALEKVGISIFEQTGEIKNMDKILDEMAAKWVTLNKDQQIALAQTVAGVRQYTQLVALMDNWNNGDSDSMMANLATSKNAEGTLQSQADIYAQSWEAARDRVKAATEDLFDSIIDEEFFITILNGFEDLLSGVANFTDAINGLPGILSLLGAVMTRVFSKQITESVNNLAFTVESLTGKTKKNANELQQQALEMAKNINFDTGTEAGDREGQAMQNRLDLQQQIKEISSNLTQEEQEQLVKLLEINDAYAEQAILAAKAKDAASQKTSEASAEIRRKVSRNEGKDGAASMSDYKTQYAAMQELATHGAKAAESLNKVNNALKNKKDATGFGNEIEKVALHLERVNRPQGAANLRKLFDDFKSGKVSAEDFEVKLREVVVAEELLQDTSIAMSDGLYDVAKGSQVTQGECDALADRMIELAQATLTSDNANTAYQQSVVELKNSIAGFHGALDSFGTNVTKTMQGISSLAMAASSLKSAFDTLKNPDLSFGEKLLQVTMSLSMAIPALIAGLKALNAEQLKKNAADLKAIGVGAIHLVQTGMRTAGAWGEAIANQGVTASLWQQVAAWIAVHIAALPVSVVILLIVAALAAFVAVVAGVVLAANAIADAYNADAIAAEKAETAAKNLAEAYGEVKSEYEDMISSMEKYQSARDGLDSLTKGTEAYEQALKEANRMALELINTYGLIEGQDYNWEGNEIVINESAMNDRIRAKEREADKVYAASQMAGVEARERRAQADQTALRRSIRDDNGLGNGDRAWAAVANTVIAGIGVALAPVTFGLSALAVPLAMANEALIETNAQSYDAAINKAVEEAKTNENLFDSKEIMAQTLQINDEDLINALWENRSAIQQLSNEMNAVAQAEKVAAQNTANEIMSSTGYQNSEAGRMALEAGGEVYTQLYNDAYKAYLEDASSRGLFNTGTDASKAAFEAYAKEMGLDQLKNFKVTNYKGDGTVEYKYIDDEGKEQVKLATAEEIASILAASKAAGELEGSLSNLRNVITDLNNSKDLGDHALANFLSDGNLENATYAEYQDLKNDVTDENGNIDSEKVDDLLGLTGDAEADLALAKSRGYATAQAYRDAFIESLDVEWEIPSGLDKAIVDSLSIGAANRIQQVYEDMGKEGGQAFIDALNTVADSEGWDALSLDEQTDLMNEMANIDWSSWDAGERAIEIAESYGVAIDGTSEAWKRHVETMRDASNALPDLEQLRDTIAQVKEISEDMQIGDILSEEDYNLLVKYNKELERYFATLSDGSVQFVGDILDFQQEVEESGRQKLIEAQQIYLDRNKEILEQQQAGLDVLKGVDVSNYSQSQNFVGEDGKNYYQSHNVNTQLDFLESQGYDSEQLATWRQDLSDGSTTISVLEEIGDAVNNTAGEFENLGHEAEENQKLINGLMNEIALGAESAEERAQLLKDGIIDENAMNYAAMAAHNQEKWEDLDPKEVDTYAKSLRGAAKASDLLSDELAENEEAAEDVALYTKKMNKGIEALSEGFEGWSDVLKKSDSASEEYADAMNGIKTAMSDVLGVSEEFISDQFILDHMEDIKLAAEGDAEAIDRLAIAAAKDILVNIKLQDEGVREELYALHDQLAAEIPDIEVGATLDDGDFLSKAAQVVETAGMTVDQANAYFRALGFEPHFETKEEKVTTMKPRTRTHTDYALSSSSVGFDLGPFGKGSFSIPTFDAITTSWNEGYTPIEETVQIPALTTDGGKPNFTLTRTNSGAMNNSSSSNKGSTSPKKGGGGSGKTSKQTASAPSKMDKGDETHKSDVVKRYKEIDDSLDDLADSYERANREADKLFGVDKLEAIEKENELLQEQQKLIEKKAKEAKKYMAIDKAELDEVAKEAGLNFSYDENGNITNYTDQMTNLHNQLAAAEETYNNMVDEYNAAVDAAVAQYGDELPEELAEQLETKQEAIEAYEENVLSKIRDTITSVEDAMALYEESKELYEELGLEAEDIANQIRENNYRIISEGLELRITLNEDDLELIEYQLGKLEDDFYSMAEAIALMVGSGTATLGGDGTQLGEYIDNLNHYKNTMEELERAYAAGEITEASYIEGMKEVRSGMLENLQAIQELDNAMMNYYEETLAAGQEELDKYTSKMEHQTAVLEHYMSIMEILGKSQDYESLGVILEAQAKSIGNEAKVAKENYEMLQAQADAKKAAYEAASTPEEAELLKKEWEAAQVAANEAQDEMLAKTAEWAEAMTAVAQNKLKGLGQALEDALTAGFGGSFDAMTTSMQRANSLQEEYLTTTNQIYETNKLMHSVQKEIDKTSNDVAKRKMKDFITETKQLQDQTKLSKYELDIQKAKYDLLLAEIALEEAQSAKSTVRLQRDSEGNFGYVYTADKTAVDNAQQAFEDAQNNLYNIGLEGTNNYTQKYQETLNEFYDTMTSLQEQYLNGEFQNEEEYQAAMQSAREFYYAKLQEYSSLNSVALSTDARVVEDAWTKEFRNMTQQTDLWMQNVDGYVRNVMGVFDEWQTQMAEVRKTTVGPDLVALKENTQEIVEASDALAEAVTKDGGVIDALEEEYNAVSKITGAYAQYRDVIAELIAQYDGFMGRINTTVNTAAGTGNSSPTPGPEGFASGGYTGEWGPGGKIAMLHQKELILKEGDTENFLASLEVLRDIVKVIDLHAMNAQLGGLLNSPQYHDYEGSKEVLEQQVHIEASFPNVSDRYEIEEALTTLVNKASQFTNR